MDTWIDVKVDQYCIFSWNFDKNVSYSSTIFACKGREIRAFERHKAPMVSKGSQASIAGALLKYQKEHYVCFYQVKKFLFFRITDLHSSSVYFGTEKLFMQKGLTIVIFKV